MIGISQSFRNARSLALGFLIVFLAAFSAGFAVTPALAHSDLETSTPAEGASVSTLTEITLTFAEEVVPEFSKYTLVDEMGMVVALGTPKYDVSKTTVTVPVTGALMNAKYAIGYAVLSIDGHPISGRVNFVSTASGPTPSPTNSHSQTTTPGPAPSGDSSLLANIGYAATGLVGGVIVVAIITVIMRRRNKV